MPYKAPGLGDDRLDWILVEIRQAQATLDARILEAQNLPDTEPSKASRIARLNQMKREIDNVYTDLQGKVSIWADRDVRNFYRRGHDTAAAQLSTGFSFTTPHKDAIDIISFDAFDDVATRLQQVSDGFGTNIELQKIFEGLDPSQVTVIQEQGRSAVAQMLLTGEDPRKISKRLAQDLWSQGVSIIDSSGRQWNPETYTRMLVRTKSANAYNAGSMNKYAEHGVSRVRVFDGVEDDPECAQANGEIWALEYAMQHVVEHPNCRRAFAPEQGDGPVDRKSENSIAVVFDRIELGATALVALRSFRRTGEINVSSTLARLLTEFVELQSGLALPIVDQFIMGAIGQGFRNADAWVEAYVDPILFAAGLIDEVPNRAQLVRMQSPVEWLDSLESAVARTAQKHFPRDGRAIQVLDKIDGLIGKAEAGLAQVIPGLPGALKWVDWTSAELLATHRLGQIVGETVLVIKNGEIDDLKSAWREASEYVDQMAQLRRDHQALMMATHEEAVELVQDIGRSRHTIAEILETEDFTRMDDNLRDFLDEFSLDPTLRHLELLDDELKQVQFSAYHRAQTTRQLAKARDNKVLPFPASAGPDFLSEAGDYWDLDTFEGSARLFNQMLADVEAVPLHHIRFLDEGGEALGKLAKHDEARTTMIEGITDLTHGSHRGTAVYLKSEYEGTAFWDALVVRGIVNPVDEEFLDAEKYLDFMVEAFQRLGFDGRRVTFQGGEITDEVTAILQNLMPEARNLFINISLLEARFPNLIEPLLRFSPDADNLSVHTLWSRHTQWVRSAGPIDQVLTGSNIGLNKVLNTYFDDVIEIQSGINTSFIFTLPTGERLFLKQFTGQTRASRAGLIDGGVQGRAKGFGSQALTSFIARQIGEVEAPPTQVWHLGDDFGILHPALDDIEELNDFGRMRPDQSRRQSLLDYLTIEYDGHRANTIVNQYNETVFSIDSEAGLYHNKTLGWISNAAFEDMNSHVDDAWGALDDINFAGNDPPALFVRLTEPEYEFASDRLPEGFDHIKHSLPVPIVQDVNGDYYLIAGRTGRIQSPYDANQPDLWYPSFFLTDSELEFVLKPRDEIEALFLDEIKRLTDDLPDNIKREFTNSWVVGPFEELQQRLAADAAGTVVRQIDEGIEGGMLNITGGIREYISPTGLKATVGESIIWSQAGGAPEFGTVVNILEARNGDQVAQVAVGLGFQQAAAQLDNLAGGPRLRIINLSSADVTPADFVPEPDFAQGVVRRLNEVLESTGPRGTVVTYDTTDGIFKPKRAVQIQISNHLNSDNAMRYRLGSGIRTNYVFEGTIQNELLRIIDDEINKTSSFNRPSRVVLSSRVFEIPDGRRAFGMFDAEDRVLYISATGLFPDVTPTQGQLVFDSLDALNDAVDYDAFTRVLRHEVNHGIDVGAELAARSNLNDAIWRQMISQHPDLITQEDWFKYAEDQLRLTGRVDLLGTENPLATLVEFRTSIIEDITNSNNVAAGKRLAERGLPDSIAPEVINALKRGDPSAHHELAAEIGGVRSLGTWMAANRVDGRQGETAKEIRRAISRDHPLKNLPISDDFWYGPGLAEYVEFRLDPDAVLVPKLRSANQQFWQEVPLSTESLIERRASGFTYDVIADKHVERGYSYSIEANQRIIRNVDELTDDELDRVFREYYDEHRDLLDQDDWYLGGWYQEETGFFYLDTSRVDSNLHSAAEVGFRENQLALYDLERGIDVALLSRFTDYDDWLEGQKIRADLVDVLLPKNKRSVALVSDPEGRPLPLSLKSIPKAQQEAFLEAYAKRIIHHFDNPDVVVDSSPAAIRRRLETVLERARQLYEDNPNARDAHRFYERWNLLIRDTAVETNISMPRIIAGASAMSPKVKAEDNLAYAIFMAKKLADDKPLTQREVRNAKAFFKELAENFEEDYGKPVQAAEFRKMGRSLKVGDRLSQMDIEKATRVMHSLRTHEVGKGFAGGWSFSQFVRGARVIRGDVPPIDVLGDTKVRSFNNNIVDPLNRVGVSDVTADFHMVDASLFGNTKNTTTVRGIYPRPAGGLAWGIRVIISDVIRDMFDDGLGVAVDARSPAELQEVLWAVWQEGKREGWWGEIPVLSETVIP